MGAFSARAFQTAKRLLSKYGQPITGSHIIVSDSDVTTGEVDPDDNVPYTGVGYPGNYRDSMIDGTLIKRDDIRLILWTNDVPMPTDVITISNKEYTALNVQLVTAQGQTIIYKIQCRT